MNFSDGTAPNTNVFPGFKSLRGEVLTETFVFPFLNRRGCKVASRRGLRAISCFFQIKPFPKRPNCVTRNGQWWKSQFKVENTFYIWRIHSSKATYKVKLQFIFYQCPWDLSSRSEITYRLRKCAPEIYNPIKGVKGVLGMYKILLGVSPLCFSG